MKVEIRSRDLDSGSILSACRTGAIPANGIVPAAIAAHQIAYACYRARGGQENRRMAMLTLRTVILAMTPEPADSQQQLDYLVGLPIEAWGMMERPNGYRRSTLTAISWIITRHTDN